MPITLLCIRHGESTFNATWPLTRTDPLHWDARLSERGHDQVRQGRAALVDRPVEVVLVSPLTRALQTALGLFEAHPAQPAMEVVPLLRERVESSCDVGRAPSELAADFPHLAFAHLPRVWWHAEGEPDERGVHVEPEAIVQQRVDEFRRTVLARRERTIAVVGHGTFLRLLTGKALANCEVTELSLAAPEADGRVG